MRWFDTTIGTAGTLQDGDVRPGAAHLGDVKADAPGSDIVEDELHWRRAPGGARLLPKAPRITATRWRNREDGTREFSAETAADCHVLSIVLRNEDVRLSVSARTVHDGIVPAGTVHITQPAAPARCVFRGPYDVLHLHVPNSMVAEFNREITGGEAAVRIDSSVLARDPAAEALGRSLLDADKIGGSFGQLYADNVCNAVLARLLSLSHQDNEVERRKVSGLAKWRLKRALDFVEARFSDPVTLGDMAAATGLTRMHFAAQFKAAMGLRPHEYLLRRRIDHAQGMLVRGGMSVVDVALAVGFQTQSQFTTVFKRFTGKPPYAWRASLATST
jgi:AraC family transcriptional regulator